MMSPNAPCWHYGANCMIDCGVVPPKVSLLPHSVVTVSAAVEVMTFMCLEG